MTLFAVKMMNPAVVPLVQQTYLGDAFTVAIVLACIAAWVAALWSTRGSARRLVLAAGLALLIARPLGAVICPSCGGCDEFWLTWFWICLP